MKLLRTMLASTALVAVAAPAAWAQTAPINGGTEVGGIVPSYIELILTQPATAFTTFPKAKTYQLSFDALVTSTDPGAQLTLVDGDVASGSKLGRLASGAKLLPQPLDVKAGTAFQPLNASVGPLVKKWGEAKTRDKATVTLRQKVTRKAAGNYRKVVLVTLSSDTP